MSKKVTKKQKPIETPKTLTTVFLTLKQSTAKELLKNRSIKQRLKNMINPPSNTVSFTVLDKGLVLQHGCFIIQDINQGRIVIPIHNVLHANLNVSK